jgi:hypothetical protein
MASQLRSTTDFKPSMIAGYTFGFADLTKLLSAFVKGINAGLVFQGQGPFDGITDNQTQIIL